MLKAVVYLYKHVQCVRKVKNLRKISTNTLSVVWREWSLVRILTKQVNSKQSSLNTLPIFSSLCIDREILIKKYFLSVCLALVRCVPEMSYQSKV